MRKNNYDEDDCVIKTACVHGFALTKLNDD